MKKRHSTKQRSFILMSWWTEMNMTVSQNESSPNVSVCTQTAKSFRVKCPRVNYSTNVFNRWSLHILKILLTLTRKGQFILLRRLPAVMSISTCALVSVAQNARNVIGPNGSNSDSETSHYWLSYLTLLSKAKNIQAPTQSEIYQWRQILAGAVSTYGINGVNSPS